MNPGKSFTLEGLAELLNCSLHGNPHHTITGVADLETATNRDASFLSNPRYEQLLQHSEAGVIFIGNYKPLSSEKNYLICEDPSRVFQQLIDIFHPQRESPSGFKGIHPTAVIHETAQLEENVSVGPHAVIDEHVVIGAGTFIGAGAYIGPNTVVGKSCLIHPRVVIREECIIGKRVIIQPGAVIGACGFGFTTDKQGRHNRLNQVGNVVVEDDVEIGANTTIDRARLKMTSVGQGTKIDNLVQLGHGVKLGPHNIIVAQTGIAGSSSTGRHVVLAGQVAVAGHLRIGDEITIAGKSGVTKSLFLKGKYGGVPAIPLEEYNRNQVSLRNIDKFLKKLKALELQLAALYEHLVK